ncbi:MAG: hypothetical protein G01um101448_892 [Parcubacteria group bacterium Gr01-1014_48]|nr:MAG: hypothetical protein G01um101448_892 [Parcubacteria group bacterium Gr01-1014_48]TSD01498.1 MAG: hypothetical protein Greene101415_214 [Parcubacteria group bacterium Greene1014_15]
MITLLDLFGKSFLLQFLVFGYDFVMLRKMILAVQPVRRRIILLAFLVSLENQKFRNEMIFRRGLSYLCFDPRGYFFLTKRCLILCCYIFDSVVS